MLAEGLNILSPFERELISGPMNKLLEKEKLFPARSIHKLLWGYDDFFLDSLANITAAINEQLKKHGFIPLPIPPINPFVKLQVL